MFEKLFTYHQIDDLRHDLKMGGVSKNDYARRSSFEIAVIDDRPFAYESNLKANGYLMTIFNDIRSISEIQPYNIILCDLQGVGKYLNDRGQGAYIIDEIKRNHPEKFVIAYTGGSPDDAVTLKAQDVADFFLKKDSDIDDWRDLLDEIIRYLSNPIEVWGRQRNALVEADVPTLDILKLEDAYVRSIKERSDAPYRNFLSKSGVSVDLRAIAQSLVASGIFKAFFG